MEETLSENEDLTKMIHTQVGESPTVFSEEDLNLPTEEVKGVEEDDAQEVEANPAIRVTSLSNWVEANSESFDNINEVKLSIRGVNPAKTLIMAVKNNSGEEDGEGNEARDLRIFENADPFPVLNLPGTSMGVYSKGFQIVYDYNDDIAIKCYGIKMGLIVVFCNKINGSLIPYHVTRLKKKDSEVEIITKSQQEVVEKLTQTANLEDLQIRYKQSSKAEDLITNASAVQWLLERQAGITDINHLLQIDNVILSTLE